MTDEPETPTGEPSPADAERDARLKEKRERVSLKLSTLVEGAARRAVATELDERDKRTKKPEESHGDGSSKPAPRRGDGAGSGRANPAPSPPEPRRVSRGRRIFFGG